MGSGKYQKYLPEKKVRWVCSFCVPASELKDDFEYHITLEEKGRRLQYPYGGAVSDQDFPIREANFKWICECYCER